MAKVNAVNAVTVTTTIVGGASLRLGGPVQKRTGRDFPSNSSNSCGNRAVSIPDSSQEDSSRRPRGGTHNPRGGVSRIRGFRECRGNPNSRRIPQVVVDIPVVSSGRHPDIHIHSSPDIHIRSSRNRTLSSHSLARRTSPSRRRVLVIAGYLPTARRPVTGNAIARGRHVRARQLQRTAVVAAQSFVITVQALRGKAVAVE